MCVRVLPILSAVYCARRPLGPASPLIYHAASTSGCFHDMTLGDNACPFGPKWMGQRCNCSTCHGFAAQKGWDPVTGVGTPNVTCLLAFIRGVLLNRTAPLGHPGQAQADVAAA